MKYREYIISEANKRRFYLVCNGRYKRSKITGVKRQFLLVMADDYYFEISWQIAKEIANGIKTIVYS